MKTIFKFLFFLCFGIIFSQNTSSPKTTLSSKNGYEITISTKNLEGRTVKLSIYNGNYKTIYCIDSIQINKNVETISFKQKQNVIDNIYQLSISGKPSKIDILVGNGDRINFIIKNTEVEDIETNNPLNKSFIEYQKLKNNEEKISFLQSLQKKYHENKALKIFMLLELKRTLKKADNQSIQEFRKSLLEGLDAQDKTISLMPNAYAFLNFFFTSEEINNENYKAGIDLLLKDQTCLSPNFKFYTQWIFKNLELLQTKNLYEVPDYFFNKYINTTVCLSKTKNFYNASLKKVQSLGKNPIGSILPDFSMQTINQESFKWSTFNKEKVNLLVFYDPLCTHCIKEIPKIVQEINDLEKDKNLTIGKIAILNVQNSTLWQQFVKDNKMDYWTHITYLKNDTTTQNLLDVFSNPSYFLTDQKGKILLKTYHLSFIKNYLNQLN